jgi:hypothetical protein
MPNSSPTLEAKCGAIFVFECRPGLNTCARHAFDNNLQSDDCASSPICNFNCNITLLIFNYVILPLHFKNECTVYPEVKHR